MCRPMTACSRAVAALLAAVLVVAPIAGDEKKQERTELGGRALRESTDLQKGSQQGGVVPSRARTESQNTRATNQEAAEKRMSEQRAQRERPTRQRRGTGSPSLGGPVSTGANPYTSIAFNRDARLLRLAPLGANEREMNLYVLEGDEFWTQARLESYSVTEFNGLNVVIAYPQDIVEPLAINDRPLMSYLSGAPTVRIDRSAGRIHYHAPFASSAPGMNVPLLAIQWRAIRPASNAEIFFDRWRGEVSSITKDGTDLLGSPYINDDGTLGLGVSVLPKDELRREELAEAADFDYGTFERTGGVRLAIIPPKTPPRAGEVVSFDIVLDNRSQSALDAISLRLDYDPAILQIMDVDHNNPITHGINILDGPFQDRLAFGYHIENQVFPAIGQIRYRTGTDNENALRGRVVTLARVYAIAKRGTAGSYLRFGFSNIEGYPSTYVRYVGRNVLGEGDDPRTAVAHAVYAVRNAPKTAEGKTTP